MGHSSRQLNSECPDADRYMGRNLFLGLKSGFRLINGVLGSWEFVKKPHDEKPTSRDLGSGEAFSPESVKEIDKGYTSS